MIYYYDLIYRNPTTKKVEDVIQLTHTTRYNQNQFNNIVKNLRNEYYQNKKGERYKIEAFNYTLDELLALGFKYKVQFEF